MSINIENSQLTDLLLLYSLVMNGSCTIHCGQRLARKAYIGDKDYCYSSYIAQWFELTLLVI